MPDARIDTALSDYDPAAPSGSSSRLAEYRELSVELLRSKTFLVGLVIVSFWIVDALVWPLIVPYDPQALDAAATFQPPSAAHPFGTDDFGRDVLSRVLAGASPVLAVAPAATALGVFLGIVIGMIAALSRGVVDLIVMRFVDAALAFPLLVLAVAVLGVVGGSAINVIIVIALHFAPNVARTIRAVALEEREKEYVHAARLLGNSPVHVAFVEILPNIVPVIIVEFTVRLGYAIFASATLSFLTLGIQQPSPDWGLSIALGRGYLQYASWIVLFPAAALATLVVGVNLLADALKDVREG